MAAEELPHLVRRKLVPTYGTRDTEALLTRWWDEASDNDRRKINSRPYWVAYV